jgi:uncharacterized protein YdhG (YjbR/CyaY superfamily)
VVGSAEIDDYLATLTEPHRSTLIEMRHRILAVLPHAAEGIAYGAPVFRVEGVAVAGLAAFTKHLSYLPHSGTVVATLGDQLDGYSASKGAVKFPIDVPLPTDLVRALIVARLDEAGLAEQALGG